MSDDTPPAPTAGPMYPQQLVTWPTEGSLEFTDVQAGPAGVSVVELPDGVIVEVDHDDPAQLVALGAPEGLDPRSLRRWIGRRGASRRLGGRQPDDPTAPTLVPKVGRTTVGTGRARRRVDDPAVAFGRLVVAADLLDDTELEPIARLVAGVELLLELDDDPTAELLLPLRSDVRRRVEALALQVELPDDADDLSPDALRPAAYLLRSLVPRLEPRSIALERLSTTPSSNRSPDSPPASSSSSISTTTPPPSCSCRCATTCAAGSRRWHCRSSCPTTPTTSPLMRCARRRTCCEAWYLDSNLDR